MLKQIRYFLKVVECGSFSQAAQELFVSRQAIMSQTALLEKKLGGQLLERTSTVFSSPLSEATRCPN